MVNVLIVEDEVIIAMDISRKIIALGYHVAGRVDNGEAAISFVKKGNVDLILMDINLKGDMDGIAAATIINSVYEIPSIYLTAHSDPKTLEKVKKTNPYGYLRKPYTEKDLRIALELALQRCDYEMKRDSEFKIQAIESIIKALHLKNPREELHSSRVKSICRQIGEAYQLNEEKMDELITSAYLHDIGKIAIDEAILNKEGALTTEEMEEMKTHPQKGASILQKVESLSAIAELVTAHHERWDGSGYPKGLKGEEIPWMARVITIADAYDAMLGPRTYRKPLTPDEASRELVKNAGTQFDPKIVRMFVEKVHNDKKINHDTKYAKAQEFRLPREVAVAANKAKSQF